VIAGFLVDTAFKLFTEGWTIPSLVLAESVTIVLLTLPIIYFGYTLSQTGIDNFAVKVWSLAPVWARVGLALIVLIVTTLLVADSVASIVISFR
jgi:hypothetical protein